MGTGDKTRLTEADVEHFLLRLATDDSFRAQVESDPATILSDYNINVNPQSGTIPDTVTLPSKQNILDCMDQYVDKIRDEQDGVFGYIWYIIDP